ncbi:MAG: hypothetical protein KAZ68_02280, partial [Candidatus Methylopumilus sp.]|nr:hypothetical protein [Candidatus Methylopumilus sp.]
FPNIIKDGLSGRCGGVFFCKKVFFKKTDADGSLFRNNEKSHQPSIAYYHPLQTLWKQTVIKTSAF